LKSLEDLEIHLENALKDGIHWIGKRLVEKFKNEQL
jgi:hypothetical protein